MINGRAAIALAVIPPVIIGLSRLVLDMHWATDVFSGWCVGLVIASIAAGVYRLIPPTKLS